MSGQRLLERDAERAQLAAALDVALAGQGRVVTAEGEAGLGKSTLLALAAELAHERGMRVLAATGGVLEQDVAWGVVRQLLEPLVLGPEPVAGLLDGPARAAAPVFGLPGPVREAAFPVDSAPGLEHALFRIIVTLCDAAPGLVLVDDAHWCDEASPASPNVSPASTAVAASLSGAGASRTTPSSAPSSWSSGAAADGSPRRRAVTTASGNGATRRAR